MKPKITYFAICFSILFSSFTIYHYHNKEKLEIIPKQDEICTHDDCKHLRPNFNIKQYQNTYVETYATIEYKKINDVDPLYLSLDIYKPYSLNNGLKNRPVIVFFIMADGIL